MKIDLSKAQVRHLKYLLKLEQEELNQLLSSKASCVDMRYCRNNLKVTNNILEKIL
jgi:hypothetical protein|nr:hypothetical protein [uncultured Mediterranean phage uvMED]